MKKEILIVDIEATGLNKKKAAIVEIGAVALDLDTGDVREVFNSLLLEERFSPEHWEYVTMKEQSGNEPPRWAKGWIFGNSSLKPGDVMEAPLAENVLDEFQKVVDQFPLGAAAYNFPYDSEFLKDRGIVFLKELPDPMRILTPVCKLPKNGRGFGYKWPKVQEAWDFFFGKDTGYIEEHRGLDDAKHEAKIIFEVIKRGYMVID